MLLQERETQRQPETAPAPACTHLSATLDPQLSESWVVCDTCHQPLALAVRAADGRFRLIFEPG